MILFCFCVAIRQYSSSIVSGEPSGPNVKTSSIPGPASKQLMQELAGLQVCNGIGSKYMHVYNFSEYLMKIDKFIS